MSVESKIVLESSKEALERFKSLPKDEDKHRDESMLCPYCLKVLGAKISRNDTSHRVWNSEKSEFRRVRCKAEKEFRASLYYDNRLKQLRIESPNKTPLIKLYDVKSNFIHSSFVVSKYTNFCVHLKAFIRDLVWDYHYTDFDYGFLTVPDLRRIKFEEGNKNFNQLDKYKVLVFDLEEEGHFNISDVPHLKELMTHRERNFLPIWFLNSTPTITNKHVCDPDIRNKIQSLAKVQLDGDNPELKPEFFIEEVGGTSEKVVNTVSNQLDITSAVKNITKKNRKKQ